MAKTEAEIAAKAAKKEKKRKRESAAAADTDVSMVDASVVDSKPKKSKKTKNQDDDVSDDEAENVAIPLSHLVPFALPLADESAQKKTFKIIKKGWFHAFDSNPLLTDTAAKSKAVKRGVKECMKAIRKSAAGNAENMRSTTTSPSAIIILAGDVWPMDVISHIPVACEEKELPYLFVPSRVELGSAAGTKRATSIIMVTEKAGKKAEDEEEEWSKTYKSLHKLAVKLSSEQNVW